MAHKPPTLNERLAEQKRRLQAEAGQVGPGSARNNLIKKIRQLDVAAHMNEWLSSTGLRAPT
jgi:hypothetical protein